MECEWGCGESRDGYADTLGCGTEWGVAKKKRGGRVPALAVTRSQASPVANPGPRARSSARSPDCANLNWGDGKRGSSCDGDSGDAARRRGGDF